MNICQALTTNIIVVPVRPVPKSGLTKVTAMCLESNHKLMTPKLFKICFLFFLSLLSFGAVSKSVVNTSASTVDSLINAKLVAKGVPAFTRKLLIAQARFESGNYTNTLAKKHNNLYGMLHPRKRPTTSMGRLGRAEGRIGYAQFRSLEDCIDDQLLYFEYIGVKLNFKNTYEFALALKKNYYYGVSVDAYTKGLKHYMLYITINPT